MADENVNVQHNCGSALLISNGATYLISRRESILTRPSRSGADGRSTLGEVVNDKTLEIGGLATTTEGRVMSLAKDGTVVVDGKGMIATPMPRAPLRVSVFL